MKIKMIRNLVLALIIISGFSCRGDKRCIRGDGNYIVEHRTVTDDIYGVEMDGSFQVYIINDSSQRIIIDADSNLISHIS